MMKSQNENGGRGGPDVTEHGERGGKPRNASEQRCVCTAEEGCVFEGERGKEVEDTV